MDEDFQAQSHSLPSTNIVIVNVSRIDWRLIMNERTLYLFDGINKSSVKDVIESIIKINQFDEAKDKKEKDYKRTPIELIINSNGGSVYDGLGLIDVIEHSKTPVHTYVYGLAASMSLLIAVSGHKRYSGRLSTFMYHSVSNTIGGHLEHLRNRLDEVQRLQNIYDEYLVSKTNFKLEDLKSVQDHQRDWFMSPEEALKLGIVDEMIQG
ncbi:ATP-dependent Clp protease proteolytic subunit [Paenibacillus cremeus]|uniref:ATP-dependent Clp protease proteolytic subunit n=2 Tax=Paenibacillus cremeus TaxID=2163881 RepID=A0A559K7P3_9BACL|nr:ATP-dependent Clp protease proteolytic subunit [Paenibacillus cremeus]